VASQEKRKEASPII